MHIHSIHTVSALPLQDWTTWPMRKACSETLKSMPRMCSAPSTLSSW